MPFRTLVDSFIFISNWALWLQIDQIHELTYQVASIGRESWLVEKLRRIYDFPKVRPVPYNSIKRKVKVPFSDEINFAVFGEQWMTL